MDAGQQHSMSIFRPAPLDLLLSDQAPPSADVGRIPEETSSCVDPAHPPATASDPLAFPHSELAEWMRSRVNSLRPVLERRVN